MSLGRYRDILVAESQDFVEKSLKVGKIVKIILSQLAF
jgi:hypothetical protein